MRKSFVVAAGVIALAASAASAQTFNWIVPLSPQNEVPSIPPGTGTGQSNATGVGNVSYNAATNLLSWDIDFSGLTNGMRFAHFHGPAAIGANAGVRITIPNSPAAAGVNSGEYIGSTTISEAFETELLGGLWYINIHSNGFPGGELRGQVIPEPASLSLLGLGALGLLARRRK